MELYNLSIINKKSKKVYIETYGCQMNESDSEIVLSVMGKDGFEKTNEIDLADVILINTCAIRDNAEQRIHGRLKNIKFYKKQNPKLVVGVLGVCRHCIVVRASARPIVATDGDIRVYF